jgi:hypothetical protein
VIDEHADATRWYMLTASPLATRRFSANLVKRVSASSC